jgi:hypothetical protein
MKEALLLYSVPSGVTSWPSRGVLIRLGLPQANAMSAESLQMHEAFSSQHAVLLGFTLLVAVASHCLLRGSICGVRYRIVSSNRVQAYPSRNMAISKWLLVQRKLWSTSLKTIT